MFPSSGENKNLSGWTTEWCPPSRLEGIFKEALLEFCNIPAWKY
jgi:hypothetical protein